MTSTQYLGSKLLSDSPVFLSLKIKRAPSRNLSGTEKKKKQINLRTWVDNLPFVKLKWVRHRTNQISLALPDWRTRLIKGKVLSPSSLSSLLISDITLFRLFLALTNSLTSSSSSVSLVGSVPYILGDICPLSLIFRDLQGPGQLKLLVFYLKLGQQKNIVRP